MEKEMCKIRNNKNEVLWLYVEEADSLNTVLIFYLLTKPFYSFVCMCVGVDIAMFNKIIFDL